MSFTPFGKFVKDLLVSHKKTNCSLAETLGCTPAYLSKVIHGKRSVPTKWLSTIINVFKLDETQIATMKKAYHDSQAVVKIDLTGQSNLKRQVAITFARMLDKLTEPELQAIRQYLP